MKPFRSTLILLVVLAGLVGYIYFVESKKPATTGEEAKAKVFSVKAEQISEVAIKPASGEQTVVKKNGGTWDVVQPVQAQADQSEVSGVTSALAGADIERVVDETPSDLKQYGLAEPRVDIAFKTSDGKQSHRLLLGDKTPTGADLYAKLPGEKKVFLVAASMASSLNRSAFDLRDKTVLKFDRNAVNEVGVTSGATRVQLVKTGEEWALNTPAQARADYGTVEGLIGRLQTTQMKSIVATDAKDLKEYGLDKPDITASLRANGAEATLLIGGKAADGTLYARDASRPLVFTVESSLAEELKKPANDYRRKDVFEVRPYNATRIEVTRGNDTLAFEKAKGQGKDATEKWRQLTPAARDVDTAKMDDFLTKITNLRVQSWADASTKVDTEKPVLAITAKFDDGKKQEQVTFRRIGTDVYVTRAGEAGAAKVETAEFDEAVKALDAVK